MPTNYPQGLDNFTDPTPADNLNNPLVLHSDEHANANDAIEALEQWVGISGSLNSATIEYRVNHPPGGAAGLGVVVWASGTFIATGTILNFTGDAVSVSASGTVIQIFITGSIGPIGPSGSPGSQGPIGPSGSPGSQGPIGPSGSPGSVGPQGPIGPSGSPGIQGIQGPSGSQGPQGVQGPTGAIGPQGVPGTNGAGGIFAENYGVPVGTGTIFNFGNELQASISGSTLQVDVTGATMYLAVDGSRLITYSASGTFIVISNSPDPKDNIGFYAQQAGIPLGTGTILNVRGANAAFTISGTILDLFITGVTYPPHPGDASHALETTAAGYAWSQGKLVLNTGSILTNSIPDLQFYKAVNLDYIQFEAPATVLTVSSGSNTTFQTKSQFFETAGYEIISMRPIQGTYSSQIYLINTSFTTRTWTFPDQNGTVALLTDISGVAVLPPGDIGMMGWNGGIPLGTGTVLNVNGSRLVMTLSGTTLNLSNSSDPAELIGVYGQQAGTPIGTGTVINFRGSPPITVSLSGTVLDVFVTGQALPSPVLGVMGQNIGVPLATGTTLNINGTRLVATSSGTVIQISNSPDPTELIGVYGVNQGTTLGTGTTFSVTGSRLAMSLVGTTLNLISSPDPAPQIGAMFQHLGTAQSTGTTLNVIGSIQNSGTVFELRVPKVYTFVQPAAGVAPAYVNLPAADTLWPGTQVYADLVGYSQARLSGWFDAVAPATTTGTIVHLKFTTNIGSPSYSEAAKNPNLDGHLVWKTSTYQTSNWFPLATSMIVDPVGIALFTTGGNGTADPSFGVILAEFR